MSGWWWLAAIPAGLLILLAFCMCRTAGQYDAMVDEMRATHSMRGENEWE